MYVVWADLINYRDDIFCQSVNFGVRFVQFSHFFHRFLIWPVTKDLFSYHLPMIVWTQPRSFLWYAIFTDFRSWLDCAFVLLRYLAFFGAKNCSKNAIFCCLSFCCASIKKKFIVFFSHAISSMFNLSDLMSLELIFFVFQTVGSF